LEHPFQPGFFYDPFAIEYGWFFHEECFPEVRKRISCRNTGGAGSEAVKGFFQMKAAVPDLQI
jgi:hypothetical protein